MTSIGAVVGRFQVARLSDGHRFLIDRARTDHQNVVVLVGSAQEWGTNKNPLNFATRMRMIMDEYPAVTCVPLPDFPGNNKRWSHHLDVTLRSLGWSVTGATLYAGRDSFKPHYVGEFNVVEVESGMDHISGTSVRANIGRVIVPSEDFRRGIIYATQNPFSPEAQAAMYQKIREKEETEKKDPPK